MNKFLIIIEKAGRNYSAYSPDLPGCISTGRMKEPVRRNMQEAIKFHLDGLREDGIPIPTDRVDAAWVAVDGV